MKPVRPLLHLLVLFLVLTLAPPVPAVDQKRPSGGTAALVKADVIEARLKEVEASTSLDDKSKGTLVELYRKALSNLEAASANEEAAQAFIHARKTAPDAARAIREKLEKSKKAQPSVSLNIPPNTPIAEIEQKLLAEKANQAAVEAKLAELEEQLADQTDRPKAVRDRLSEARQLQEEIARKLKQPAPAGESPALAEARRWNLQTHWQALNSEIRMLDQELLSQPMRIELLKARIDEATRSSNRIRERVRLLKELVNERRREEAQQAKVEAEAAVSKVEMEQLHPLVQQLAKQNAELSEQLSKISAALDRVASGDETANAQAKQIEDEFRATRQKLEVAGLSQALGQVLLEQRRSLPDLRSFRKKARKRESLIAEATLRQIQYGEERKRLRNIDSYVDELTTGLAPEEAQGVRADLRELAQKRKDLIDKAIALNDAYLRALGELDFAERRLMDAVQEYNDFLAERLLWVRSSPPPSLDMLAAFPRQVLDLLSPARWSEVVEVLFYQATDSPLLWFSLVLVLVLLWKSRAMREALLASGKKVIKPRSDRFRYTLQALLLTLLLAAPWPLLAAVLGYELRASLETSDFPRAIGHGLTVLAPAYFYLRALRIMCLPGGLADAHFRWPRESLVLLRRDLRRLMLEFLPTALIAVVVVNSSSVSYGGGLGRLAFVIVMLSLMAFFYRLFGPGQKTLQGFLQRHPDTVLARYRKLWLLLSLLLPALLIVLAIAGYLYTAGILTESLIRTLWLLLGFIVLHQLAVRWLLMTRRRLAFEAAVERRRAALEAQQTEEESADSESAVEEPEIDLVALNEESRKLLNVVLPLLSLIGLWFIWSDVLPAFGFLENISLWHHRAVVEGAEKLLPVTLADVLLALLIVLFTVVAAKHFPSLLEIILLQRFQVSSGGRYAVTTLSRYAIAAIGTLAALSIVGASWSQVQWLAAALTVGIGFGLQEIVANFISGIILLFERPIRVGDVVTVGDTNGTVTRIRIRATTIRNWDRQELLVPNKEFITGRLLNWSLSDQTTRIKVPVGIAYGSDVQQAMKLMDEAARENEAVLEDPGPSIVFDQFGDNSLNLTLRCFVGTQDARMPTLTALHQAINDKFNAAGIVISFPQRDVHLDTTQPLDVRIHRAGDGEE
ncbi:MAG TPA: mechanosensitive ion channel [Gammaproteobacteria bacterium]|nr:mechanosensitive ion channel [Gammaproteobacteria bacterium]